VNQMEQCKRESNEPLQTESTHIDSPSQRNKLWPEVAQDEAPQMIQALQTSPEQQHSSNSQGGMASQKSSASSGTGRIYLRQDIGFRHCNGNCTARQAASQRFLGLRGENVASDLFTPGPPLQLGHKTPLERWNFHPRRISASRNTTAGFNANW